MQEDQQAGRPLMHGLCMYVHHFMQEVEWIGAGNLISSACIRVENERYIPAVSSGRSRWRDPWRVLNINGLHTALFGEEHKVQLADGHISPTDLSIHHLVPHKICQAWFQSSETSEISARLQRLSLGHWIQRRPEIYVHRGCMNKLV